MYMYMIFFILALQKKLTSGTRKKKLHLLVKIYNINYVFYHCFSL